MTSWASVHGGLGVPQQALGPDLLVTFLKVWTDEGLVVSFDPFQAVLTS